MNRSLFVRIARCAVLVLLLTASVDPATAQDATQEPSDDSELAPQLPPVDLPTMNAMNHRFEVDAVWTGSAGTPEEMPVYRFQPVVYSEEEVIRIAGELGVEGEISAQGEGSYSITGNGSIFTTPGLLQYVSAAEVEGEELPGDTEAIAFARDWLRTMSLLPANIDDGEVLTQIDAPARKIVGFQPSSPTPLLSSTPGITVTLGPAGTVIEARINWAEITETDVYRLRTVEDAFAVVESRQSYLDVSLPADDFPQGTTVSGVASFDRVSVAYSSSGVPGDTQYMQPVYVFEGSLATTDFESTYEIIAYVPAIVTGLEPVG